MTNCKLKGDSGFEKSVSEVEFFGFNLEINAAKQKPGHHYFYDHILSSQGLMQNIAQSAMSQHCVKTEANTVHTIRYTHRH